jgi:hypothetical protein
MSLDVFVACTGIALLPAHLPADVKWQAHQTGSFTTENLRENWIIEIWLVTEPKQLQAMSLPSGTKSVVGVSIQGSSKADETAQKVVDVLSERCHGVLL